MSILLSGSSGFIGSNLKEYLTERNVNVVSVSRNDQIPPSITWQQISEVPNMAIEAVIHLAGKSHDTSNSSSPEEYFAVNTELTKQIFDVFLQSGAKDFIYFSSVKAVADSVMGRLNETTFPNPKTPYGVSKLKAEEYILSKSLPQGKRVIIFRPCMIHGPGNKGNLNLLFNVVKRGIPYPLAAFDNKRSFLSIRNLLFAVESIMKDASIPGGIYNLADDDPLSTNDVIKIIGEGGDFRTRLLKISPILVKIVAKSGDVLHFPLNSERLRKLTESYVVSNKKILEGLGIQSFPVSSRDGLLETIRSFSKDR